MNFIFFGTDDFSVGVLNELKKAGLMPKIIITAPDRPAGRGNQIQKPEAKIWAEKNKVRCLQPERYDNKFLNEISGDWDIFALASYGRIIPDSVLDIPKKGTLNVHPSLLPKYRGASPIESAMLADDKNTGVTIMLMDEKMDHGPILLQELMEIEEWPAKIELEKEMAQIGGQLLAGAIPLWMNDEIVAENQNHSRATFTLKMSKSHGLIEVEKILNLKDLSQKEQRDIFLKIQAFSPWPSAFFFLKTDKEVVRVKITESKWTEDGLEILKVLPAGRKEMSWDNFRNGFLNK
jgi:methionyl-tRNA formyltransferase